ncbi:MAG: biotin/lipoyl-containing protein, partial [Sandaracinaceae bacterium]
MEIRVPLLNANEDELSVVEVRVDEGAPVRAGELLVTVESTKAATEIESPVSGYVRGLALRVGDRVSVGTLVCVITATADEPVAVLEMRDSPTSRASVRATRKAQQLAKEHGVDLSSLAVRGIVKERDVLAFVERNAPALAFADRIVGPNPIVVLGAGGHARVIVDLLRQARPDLTIIGALDDSPRPARDVLGLPVFGPSARLESLRADGVAHSAHGVGAVTHNPTRVEVFERLAAVGYEVPALVHPKA